MLRVLDPFRFVLMAVAGWINQRQLQVIDYLREENRVLREQLGERRLRFTDDSDGDWPPRRQGGTETGGAGGATAMEAGRLTTGRFAVTGRAEAAAPVGGWPSRIGGPCGR